MTFEHQLKEIHLQLQAETERYAVMALELTHLDHRHTLRYDQVDYVDGAGATDGVVKVIRTMVFWCDLTPSIVCPLCGQRSWNPNDVCRACHLPW